MDKKNNALQAGRFVFSGYLGKKVDTLAHARLLDPEVWDRIYPETEAAFRHRVDDTMKPGRGLWQGEFWGKHGMALYVVRNIKCLSGQVCSFGCRSHALLQ